MKKILSSILTSLILILSATSCNDHKSTGGNYYPDDVMIDIATFVSSNENGSVFTVQKDADSQVVTLVSTRAINNKQIEEGSRVLIQYVPESGIAYMSGPIELYSISTVDSNLLKGTASEYKDWFSDLFSLGGLWRTGHYINMWANIDVESRPSTFALVLDSTTADDECPEYHIIFEADGNDTRRHVIYGSYDISDVWNKETCTAVRVYYPDIHGGSNSLVFYKTTTGIKPVD